MARNVIKFEGLYELQKGLKKNITLDHVKDIVQSNGRELHDKAQRKADFKGHYEWEKGKGRVFKKPTGFLKDHIFLEMKDGGLTAEVEPQAEYSAYVELGTRFMASQPYLKPAWEEQCEIFKSDMQKLVR